MNTCPGRVRLKKMIYSWKSIQDHKKILLCLMTVNSVHFTKENIDLFHQVAVSMRSKIVSMYYRKNSKK